MTYEDLDKVPYAAAIIYEGMRMWPPVTPAVGLVCNSWMHSYPGHKKPTALVLRSRM